MKATSLLLILAIASLTACGSGGPATRTGRAIDHGMYKAGHGIKKAGQGIQNAAR